MDFINQQGPTFTGSLGGLADFHKKVCEIEFDIAWSNNFCCGVKFAKRIKRAKVNSLRQSAINQYIGADMAKDVQAEDEIENGAQNRTPFKPKKGKSLRQRQR